MNDLNEGEGMLKKRRFGVFLLALTAAGLTVAGGAAAADWSPAPAQPTPATTHLVAHVPAHAAAVGYEVDTYISYADTGELDTATCWDHAAPSAPEGLPMATTYRNCNGYGLSVHQGYYLNGVFTEDVGCVWVDNGATLLTLRGATVPGSQYGTWAC